MYQLHARDAKPLPGPWYLPATSRINRGVNIRFHSSIWWMFYLDNLVMLWYRILGLNSSRHSHLENGMEEFESRGETKWERCIRTSDWFGHFKDVSCFEAAGHILSVRMQLYSYASGAAWRLNWSGCRCTAVASNETVVAITKNDINLYPVFGARNRSATQREWKCELNWINFRRKRWILSCGWELTHKHRWLHSHCLPSLWTHRKQLWLARSVWRGTSTCNSCLQKRK